MKHIPDRATTGNTSAVFRIITVANLINLQDFNYYNLKNKLLTNKGQVYCKDCFQGLIRTNERSYFIQSKYNLITFKHSLGTIVIELGIVQGHTNPKTRHLKRGLEFCLFFNQVKGTEG